MRRVVLHLGLISIAALVAGPSYAVASPFLEPVQLAQNDSPNQASDDTDTPDDAKPDDQQNDNSDMDQPGDDQETTDTPPEGDNSDMDTPPDNSDPNDPNGTLL
jgi:hypothetical protein